MELKDYFTPLRKLWWLILASTLVAVVVSFITVQQQPNTYRATTKLMIGRAIDNPNPTSVEFYSEPAAGNDLCGHRQYLAGSGTDHEPVGA
jgi:uncharacterized protein involved in exopolysaccharide biosynthesis